uniref:Uncharacterized protein n=1 Tax=Aegilops tauschii subsp. strangulata TaxID=200361 RepID=A0A453MH45_AEGTS
MTCEMDSWTGLTNNGFACIFGDWSLTLQFSTNTFIFNRGVLGCFWGLGNLINCSTLEFLITL